MRRPTLPTFAAAIGLTALALAVGSCTYHPRELIEFHQVEVHPKQFCSGERLFVKYDDQDQDVRWVRLRAADGTELLDLPGGTTSGLTEPVSADHLPLTAFVKVAGVDETFERELTDVVSLDDPTWVAYASTRELAEGDEILVVTDTLQEYDSENGARVDVNVYDIYRDFVGFQWQIPREDFGVRAHLLRLRNAGDRTMSFSTSYVWGDRTWVLAPGEGAEVPTPTRPWLTFEARYTPRDRRLVGWQKGEITKPENEHFVRIDLYEEQQYRLELEVVCLEQ